MPNSVDLSTEPLVKWDPAERIKTLVGQADIIVDARCPVKRYFRSGVEIVRMARMYEDEGSLENAYVLYLKYVILFLEKLRDHPDYKSVHVEIRTTANKTLKDIMKRAEKLKSKIKEKYDDEYAQLLQRHKEREDEMQKEYERLRIESEAKDQFEIERAKLKKQFVETNVINDRSHSHEDYVSFNKDNRGDEPSLYPDQSKIGDLSDIASAPIVSSKEAVPHMPSRELKPTTHPPHNMPQFDRTLKPDSSLRSFSLGLKGALRKVRLSSDLPKKFESLAKKNTDNNTETCGILAGKVISNDLLITHLLLPKQSGTSDSCTTENEENIFQYQDRYDLITLGWIHTHPSQTAFLSSVDLHTHCSYQLMMPEAIAIVCAPTKKQVGFFTLTSAGLDVIGSCQESGFHPHQTHPPLYQECDNIILSDSCDEVHVADFRR